MVTYETIRLEVRVENDTVWLTQQQMADLFLTTKQNVSLHINNIFNEDELTKNSSQVILDNCQRREKNSIRHHLYPSVVSAATT